MTNFNEEIKTCIRHLDLLNGDYPHPTIPSVANRLRNIQETMSPNAKAISTLQALRKRYLIEIKSKTSQASVSKRDLLKDIDLAIELLELER